MNGTVLVFTLLSAMLSSAVPQSPPAVSRQIVQTTQTHLEDLAKNEGFSGVVVIAKDGKPILRKAFGFANLADRIPNRIDTRFNMASMGKMITATAIMQLVQKGKIILTEKVGTYIPDFPNEAVRNQVTVEQLLTHTSGMGNFWEQLDEKAKDRYRTVSDYIPLFAHEKLQFEPGKGFAYSNNGFTVLGLIIEAVSGKTYFDYVKENIYMPCDMTDTDAFELNEPVGRMATGYSRSQERPGMFVSNTFVNTFKGGPAGGSYTTAMDLVRFANSVVNSKLLSADLTAQMTTGKVDYGTRRYAYGFTEETINGHRLIGHGGGNTGIADELMVFPDLGYTVVILTNGDVENFWDIQAFIKREILGSSPEIESYFFTKNLIDTAMSSGFQAGVNLLSGSANHPAVRSGLLEQIGYKLLWQRKTDQAIDVFRLFVTASPQAAYAYLGLGRAYEQANNTSRAIEAYQQYLHLEPDDEELKIRLKKLTTK